MNFPTKQAILAYVYSLGLSLWSVVTGIVSLGWTLGVSNGGYNDLPTFLTFMSHAWFAGILGVVFSIGPYARFVQAKAAASGNGQAPPEQAVKGT